MLVDHKKLCFIAIAVTTPQIITYPAPIIINTKPHRDLRSKAMSIPASTKNITAGIVRIKVIFVE